MHCSRNGRPSLGYTAPQITLSPGHENFISAELLMGIYVQACGAQLRKKKREPTTTTVELLQQRRQLPGWTLARDGRTLDHKVFIASQWPQKHQAVWGKRIKQWRQTWTLCASLWWHTATASFRQTSSLSIGWLRNANGVLPLIWLLISPGKRVIIIMR